MENERKSNGDHKRKSAMTEEEAEELYDNFLADWWKDHGEPPPQMLHYVLKDGVIVPEPNFFKWGKFMEEAERRIDKTVIREGRPRRERGYSERSWRFQQRDLHQFQERFYDEEIMVSTVFIGTSADELFESMVFGGLLSNIPFRWDTMGQAKQGHHELVNKVRALAGWCERRGQGRRAKKWLARRERSIEMLKRRHYQCSAELLDSLVRHEIRVLRTPAAALAGLTLIDYLRFADQQKLVRIAESRFSKAS